MLGFLILTILGVVLGAAIREFRKFDRRIKSVKRIGFDYILLPLPGIGFFYAVVNELIYPPLRALPFTSSWTWLKLNNRQYTYHNPRWDNYLYGDTFFTVDTDQITLKTTNAELAAQITTRKNDFVKPVHQYAIIDVFGRSIVSVEGQDWRRHRKVVGPSFSEKSNKLVFEESLRQARGMMELWASQGSNTLADIKVENTAVDTADLSLHVICAAGFGLPQLWPGESKEKLKDSPFPEAGTQEIEGGHALTFKQSIHGVVKGLRWLVIFPSWVLKHSPFKILKDTHQAYIECMAYFEELVEIKRKQMYLGEHDDNGTMDLMGPMIRASDSAPSDSKPQTPHAPILSRSELIGNSFIFFFAGHETTGNSIHFSILYLALNLSSQRHTQADIDAIVGPSKSISDFSYQADMPRLYNSMVGAVLNEQLRLMPAILNVPKVTTGNQTVTMDGRDFVLEDGTFIQLNVVGANRNPRYWPASPSKITPGTDDLNDFVPERWLPSNSKKPNNDSTRVEEQIDDVPDGLEQTSFDTSATGSLFKPVKGSFITFSEGMRACPGRRFAQVETTAVLTAIFQKWSVELDVSDWASDEEVARMGNDERRTLYGKAVERGRGVLQRCEQKVITLQMLPGEFVPVRFVERGRERFSGIW